MSKPIHDHLIERWVHTEWETDRWSRQWERNDIHEDYVNNGKDNIEWRERNLEDFQEESQEENATIDVKDCMQQGKSKL